MKTLWCVTMNLMVTLFYCFFLSSQTVFWCFILHSLSTASLLAGSDYKLFTVTVGDDDAAAVTTHHTHTPSLLSVLQIIRQFWDFLSSRQPLVQFISMKMQRVNPSVLSPFYLIVVVQQWKEVNVICSYRAVISFKARIFLVRMSFKCDGLNSRRWALKETPEICGDTEEERLSP